MAYLKPSVNVIKRSEEESTAKISLNKRQCIKTEQRQNVRDFGLRILHHNVQSLSNKKK
jgi:hypothetical protein